jgi:DTW domain-containing protein YfiP
MPDIDPKSTFRGLPLTEEQDAEIRHYVKRRKQHDEPWDTPELAAMLKDMLEPPNDDEEGLGATADEMKAAAERAAASIDEAMEPIEASEERNAAMESEVMRGLKR